MPEKITWSVQVRVATGPQLVTSGGLEVEAYDKLTVEIAAGASQQVDLVPAGGPVSLVVILPATPSADLTYDVGGTDIALDGPHTFFGAGAAALLGAPASLTFTNGDADPASIVILIGRDATQ